MKHRLLMPDGAVKHVHAIGHALQTSSGNLEFVGAGTDITAANWPERRSAKAKTSSGRFWMSLRSTFMC